MADKHCLQVILITDNTDILDATEDKINGVLASKLWANEYKVKRGVFKVIGEPSHPLLDIDVRFNVDTDMQTIKDWMKTKAQNVVGDLLGGSYIQVHVCNHDNNANTGCPQPTTVWSK